MVSKVSINKQAIAKMQRDLQREFDEHPIRVPINAEPPESFGQPATTTVNHYHAPVVTINGDRAQFAWGAGEIRQDQGAVSQVTPGYEEVARLTAEVLAKLDEFVLTSDEAQDARDNGELLLAEVVKPDPDKSLLRCAATMLRGVARICRNRCESGCNGRVLRSGAQSHRHSQRGSPFLTHALMQSV